MAALALAITPTAFASPSDVVADYNDNGVLDREHSMSDLNEALAYIQNRQEASYAAFEDAIGQARSERLLGLRHRADRGGEAPTVGSKVPGKDRSAAKPAGPKATESRPIESTELPQVAPQIVVDAPAGDANGGLPWPFVGLSALAGLLLMAGVGSTVIRRVNRRT